MLSILGNFSLPAKWEGRESAKDLEQMQGRHNEVSGRMETPCRKRLEDVGLFSSARSRLRGLCLTTTKQTGVNPNQGEELEENVLLRDKTERKWLWIHSGFYCS